MAKLDFNSSSIDANVIHNINNALTDIDQALQASNSLKSPYSFSGNSDISNMRSKITAIKGELNQIVAWLDQSKYLLEGTRTSVIDTFNSTRLDAIERATSIVK